MAAYLQYVCSVVPLLSEILKVTTADNSLFPELRRRKGQDFAAGLNRLLAINSLHFVTLTMIAWI